MLGAGGEVVDELVTLEELAEQTDEALARLHRWQGLGLLPAEADGRFSVRQAERIRLIQFAEQRGVVPEELARISVDQGDLLSSFVDMLDVPARTRRYSF